MKTIIKLFDGRRVTVEQTMCAITAHYEGEAEPRPITSQDYMRLIVTGNQVGTIEQ